jgi:hypothetical protein
MVTTTLESARQGRLAKAYTDPKLAKEPFVGNAGLFVANGGLFVSKSRVVRVEVRAAPGERQEP